MYLGGLSDVSTYLNRFDQISALDFVGCVKSLAVNGNEKSLFADSLNRTGLTDTCNQVEGGACARDAEGGPTGPPELQVDRADRRTRCGQQGHGFHP